MEDKKKLEEKYIPHRCPVCNGNGQVAAGFYNQVSGYWNSSTTAFESCRSCNGSGIIWK